MIQRQNHYPGPGGMFFVSLCCHLALGFLIVWWQLLPAFQQSEEPVTYVDMVTLPVASPQNGSPAAEPAPSQAAPAPAPTAPAPMALPAAKPKTKAPAKAQPAKAKGDKPAEDARQFNERLERLQRLADAKRQTEVLEKLAKNRGKTGMPGAKGTEAGIDYSSYLKSRLDDAFRREVTESTVKSPMVIATITIGPDGQVLDYHVEKGSGDPLFDEAAARAVAVAGRSLKPPPGRKPFRHTLHLKPQEGAR